MESAVEGISFQFVRQKEDETAQWGDADWILWSQSVAVVRLFNSPIQNDYQHNDLMRTEYTSDFVKIQTISQTTIAIDERYQGFVPITKAH